MSTHQNFIILGLTILLSIIATVCSGPNVTVLQVEQYLSAFGYLPSSGDNSGNNGLLNALKDFQTFGNINKTGKLDEQTKKLLLLPRCGVRDKNYRNNNRRKRFVLLGGRLQKRNLTYKIENYPNSLPRHEVDKEINRAFLVWSEHTSLTFTRKYSYYDIVDFPISFVRREHGDNNPFDGMGHTLAHAIFTIYGGPIHFDADEKWTIGTAHGTNLFQVAVHEIGHALGLDHSDVEKSVMAPFYKGYNPNFKLHDDDIRGIQSLYGKKSLQSTTLKPISSTQTLPQGHNKELCDDPKINAIFKSDNQIYVFKGEKYYKLADSLVAYGYPKLISDGWPGLPGNIDAAFGYKNDKTYFFKGTKYWKFTGRQMDDGYPKEISEDFPGVPDYLDAAMYSEDYDIIFFFIGHYLTQWYSTSRQKINFNVASWKDIPGNLDAALRGSNGFTYFFKDDKFYVAQEGDIPGIQKHIPYNTKEHFFGCN